MIPCGTATSPPVRNHGRCYLHRPWFLTGGDVAVPHGIMSDGELEYPIEEQPSTAGLAAVEAEHELVQVGGKVGLVCSPLVGTEQPPLGKGCDPVHPRQERARILSAGQCSPLATPIVDVSEAIDPAIALPSVSDHCGAWLDMGGHERAQRGGGRIGEDRHPAPAEPLGLLDLDRHPDQDFLPLRPPAAETRLFTPDVCLVDLDSATQPVPARGHEYRPQPVEHRPSCLVGADLERALQAERRDSVLGGSEQPTGCEPDRERCPGPVKDRARRHRCPEAAPCTHEPTIAKSQ